MGWFSRKKEIEQLKARIEQLENTKDTTIIKEVETAIMNLLNGCMSDNYHMSNRFYDIIKRHTERSVDSAAYNVLKCSEFIDAVVKAINDKQLK